MQLFNRYVSPRSLTAFAFEVLLITSSVVGVAHVSGSLDAGSAGVVWKVGLVTVLCLLCLYYNDLYDLTLVHSRRELIIRLLQGGGAAAIILGLLYAAIPSLVIGDGIVLFALFIGLTAILAWRVVFSRVSETPPMKERVLVVGTGSTAAIIAHQIVSQHDFGYELAGFVSEDPVPPSAGSADSERAPAGRRLFGVDVLGSGDVIPRLVARGAVDRIVVSLADRRGRLPVQELLAAKLAGVRVEDATAMYERLTGKILIDDLKPSTLIFSDGFRASRVQRIVKRAFDVSLALVGLVLSALLMLATALAVWLETGEPILYRQERVGEKGRIFTLRKFRSMRPDAEQGTPVWARDDDERVTRVGRVIRLTRLDELPQLWNVLRGEMSFVGPRPERPFFVEQLSTAIPYYQQRQAVKPGITGWAQIKYRYGASVEEATEKLRYDLYYIKHLSVIFDLTIVFDTVKVILFGRGAK